MTEHNTKPLRREDFTIEKFLRIWADLNNNPKVDMTINNVCLTVAPTKADLTTPEAQDRLHVLVQEFKQKPHVIVPVDNETGAMICVDGTLNDDKASQEGLSRCDYPELPVYAKQHFYDSYRLELDFLVSGSLWIGATLNCGDEFLTDLSPKNWILEQWWTQGDIKGDLQTIRNDIQRNV